LRAKLSKLVSSSDEALLVSLCHLALVHKYELALLVNEQDYEAVIAVAQTPSARDPMVWVTEDCSTILGSTSISNLTHERVRIYRILEVHDAEALDVWALNAASGLKVCDKVVVLLRYLRVNVEDQEILLAPPRETSLLGIEILNLDIAYRTW
jgi:hypothetical protein